MTEELVMITRFSTDMEVIEWFRVLREANEAAADPAAFADQLRERADAFDPSMVEEFLQALANAGDTERALTELTDLESQMPDLYWAYHQPRGEEEPAEDTPFGWVDDTQATQLAAAWGGEWQSHLGPQLAARWGDDWEAHHAEHKQAWLTDLLPELLGSGTEPEAADTDPFGWVLPDDAQRLADAWGGDWQFHLAAQLAPRWGDDWQSHPAEHKQAWFTDLLPELLPEPAAEAGDEVEAAAPTAAVPEKVQEEASALLDQILADELSRLDADGDLSEEELNAALTELRAELLDAPATQEG